MPRAKMSLRQHINEVGGRLAVSAALTVLSNIATALVDLAAKGVVHRDIKPENVLLLGEIWCLADFGISRYAEATTAPDTRKYMCSPPYAAPEQWRVERATPATDVYSLGVLGYELLSGSLPFSGPHAHEFREQHLHTRPARLQSVPIALEALIEECLYKAPAARPGPSNLLARMERVDESTSALGLTKLHEANLAETVRRGEQGRRESSHITEAGRRAALAEAAKTSMDRIADALKDAILQAAPAATVQKRSGRGWSIRLNQSELQFVDAVTLQNNPWGSWPHPKFDLIAHASIGVQIPPDRYDYEGRSHALWYCDARELGRYQWFETAFMISPLIPKRGLQNPFVLAPSEDSAKAFSPGLSEFQLAWPFMPIAYGEMDEFINRWADWFANASLGKLTHPSSMPERSTDGSWRRT
jgi:serine/threonine-protein kinase